MNTTNNFKNELSLQKEISKLSKQITEDKTINTLLESIADGVVVVNTLGRIVFVNKQLERLFGFVKEELLGESVSILLEQEIRDKHEKYIVEFFRTPKMRPMGSGLDLCGITKTKEKIPIEVSLSFFDSEFGKLGLAFVNDISIRKKAEKDLVERNKELDEFAGIVAHDLKNNLNNIIGFSGILKQQKDELVEEDKDEILTQISRNANKMSDIIRELLIFSRLKHEEIKLLPLDMQEIIDEAIERNQFNIKDFKTEIKVDDIFPEVLGYSPWIEEIMYNLINNAVNYCGENTIINISSTDYDSYVEFNISDNGPGIDPKYHKELFEDHSKIKREVVRGNGLGLPIAKKIIEKIGGKIWIESKLGEGTTFVFTLPKKINKTPHHM